MPRNFIWELLNVMKTLEIGELDALSFCFKFASSCESIKMILRFNFLFGL